MSTAASTAAIRFGDFQFLVFDGSQPSTSTRRIISRHKTWDAAIRAAKRGGGHVQSGEAWVMAERALSDAMLAGFDRGAL